MAEMNSRIKLCAHCGAEASPDAIRCPVCNRSVFQQPLSSKARDLNLRGFSAQVGCALLAASVLIFVIGLSVLVDGLDEQEGTWREGDYVMSEEARKGYEAAGRALGQPVGPDHHIYTRRRILVPGRPRNTGKIIGGLSLMVLGAGVFVYTYRRD